MTVKRAIDVIGASVGLLICAVPMLVISALIYLTIGAPVIYRHTRPGLHGRLFEMFKFRTMRNARDANGNALPDRDRITPLGRLLRRASLDELPELFNVLRGEMSLVGPRPLLVEYLERYSPEQARRHDVVPGITGWAQINGRNSRSWDERFALDVWYVDHASLRLDLRILTYTVLKVIRGSDISADGDLDVPRFRGSLDSRRPAPLVEAKQ